jgi:hypothetical protein
MDATDTERPLAGVLVRTAVVIVCVAPTLWALTTMASAARVHPIGDRR